jgi:ABC-type Mn2+/Zn2+ transport system permease subunit
VLGVHVRLWNLGIATWLGLTLGLSLRASGMLYAFGCLVLPALAAKSLCRSVAPMFVVAPVVSLASGVAAFVLANHYDLPPAQTAVALLAGCARGMEFSAFAGMSIHVMQVRKLWRITTVVN